MHRWTFSAILWSSLLAQSEKSYKEWTSPDDVSYIASQYELYRASAVCALWSRALQSNRTSCESAMTCGIKTKVWDSDSESRTRAGMSLKSCENRSSHEYCTYVIMQYTAVACGHNTTILQAVRDDRGIERLISERDARIRDSDLPREDVAHALAWVGALHFSNFRDLGCARRTRVKMPVPQPRQ